MNRESFKTILIVAGMLIIGGIAGGFIGWTYNPYSEEIEPPDIAEYEYQIDSLTAVLEVLLEHVDENYTSDADSLVRQKLREIKNSTNDKLNDYESLDSADRINFFFRWISDSSATRSIDSVPE